MIGSVRTEFSGNTQLQRIFLPLAAWGCIAASFSTFPSIVQASECSGVKMPERIALGNTNLVLNGMGIRRATIFSVRVYVGGLYIEKPTRNARDVLSSSAAKRLTLHFVRDVSSGEMADAINEGIRKNASGPAEVDSGLRQASKITRHMPPLRKGIELTFDYLPGKGLQVLAANRPIATSDDTNFIQLLFRIWFGLKPPDEDLKAGMLRAKCE